MCLCLAPSHTHNPLALIKEEQIQGKNFPMTLFILTIIIFIMGSHLCTANDTLLPALLVAALLAFTGVAALFVAALLASTGVVALLVVALLASTGVAALLVVGLLVSWKRKTICLIFNQMDITGDQLVAFSYEEIKIITKNFFHKLGEGGFGSVFKGSLPNSTVVAVKRMKNVFFEEKQFRTEVHTIGIIQHINLVKLLGFCSEGTKRLLVYEYMPNGSLDSHIFSNQCDGLNWKTRYNIMVGIARGLTYLHEECRDCIIHCDIKPENILLNANLCPKIADFGMAKLLGRDFSRALTTMRGTIGYLGPEWICGQPITKKADVYSFGMMLFEIISGKRNTEKFQNPECTYFPLYAAMKTRQGEIVCLLDDKLQGNANMRELNIACMVACWCIQEMETDRPSMRQVVQMLEGVVAVLMPPIPSFLQRLVDLENDSMYSVVD
ncbi:G-type lectin S-receptor-like serine/threonine-protein kinase At2g19130 isoform X1 [Carex rostrata]